MAVVLDPLLNTAARTIQLFAGRSSHNRFLSLVVEEPIEFKSQEGKSTLRAWVKSSEPQDLRFLRSYLEAELSQLFR